MDFDIPEELKMVQSLVRDFVNEQLKPLERDILGRAADLSDAAAFLPPDTEEKLVGMAMEIGLWGISVPEELGGAGLNTLGACLVEEELAQTVVPFSFGDVTPILFDCSAAQRESYFVPLLQRQRHAYLALMEPGKGGNLADMGMRARRVNGHYVLSGSKLSFSRPAGDKDYFAVVFAVTAETGPRDGVSCFLVDGNTPGFSVRGDQEETGWRTQIRRPILLTFDECRLTEDSLLGQEGKAFSLGRQWLAPRRLVRAARCVGVALRLLEEATTQAQSWQSFGQVISGRVDIEAALADIATGVHACRLMVHQAAWKSDSGEGIKREAAMVKLFATQMVHNAADRVGHIFSGPPYTVGQPMERLCRNALATTGTELALELQRSIIVKDILKGLKV